MIALSEIWKVCLGHPFTFWGSLYLATFLTGYVNIRRLNRADTVDDPTKYTYSHVGGNLLGGFLGPLTIILLLIMHFTHLHEMGKEPPKWL